MSARQYARARAHRSAVNALAQHDRQHERPALPPRARNDAGQYVEESDPEARFLSFCERADNGCLLWQGSAWGEYGRYRDEQAHVWAYKRWVGPVPDGHDVHHRCETKLCVEPQHLRPLTRREHLHQEHQNNPTIINAQKTHCIRGHELAGTNLRLSKKGTRVCVACSKIRGAANRAQSQASAPRCLCGSGRPIIAKDMCINCYQRQRHASRRASGIVTVRTRRSARAEGPSGPQISKRRESRVENGVTLWRCSRCEAFKPADAFYRNKRTLLGLTSQCKPCHSRCSYECRVETRSEVS